jgi:hypothetical protein
MGSIMPNYSAVQAAIEHIRLGFYKNFSTPTTEGKIPYLELLAILVHGGNKDEVIRSVLELHARNSSSKDFTQCINGIVKVLNEFDRSDLPSNAVLDIQGLSSTDLEPLMQSVTLLMKYSAGRLDSDKHDQHKKGMMDEALRLLLSSELSDNDKKIGLEELIRNDIIYETFVNNKSIEDLSYGVESKHHLRGILNLILSKQFNVKILSYYKYTSIFARYVEDEKKFRKELDVPDSNTPFRLGPGNDDL